MTTTLLSFISSFVTPEQLTKIRKDSGNKCTGDMFASEAIDIAKHCRYDWHTKSYPFLPKCINYVEHFDSDHDHGAWTSQFIFKQGEKYLAVEIEFYGQGDNDDSDLPMYEVKPREITTILYDKI